MLMEFLKAIPHSLVNGNVKADVNSGSVHRGIQFPLILTGILNTVKMTLVTLRKRKCQGNGVCQFDRLAADAENPES